MLPTVFEKKSDEDTYVNRLGAAKRANPSTFYLTILLIVAGLVGMFYCNWRAIGLATGATSSVVKHGLGYTFLQPFYSMWAVYYVLLGHKGPS